MLDSQNYTIVDLETTGGSPYFNRIIEIGLLRVEHGEVVEEFQTLVNPGQEIPEFITKMTGIHDRDVVVAPTFAEIVGELISKFEDAVFVAHNANFDYGFIKEEFRRLNYGFVADRLCTVRLSRSLYKEYKRHNLSELIKRFQFKVANRHRAFDDAKVLWDFLQLIHKQFEPSVVEKAMKQVLTKHRASSKIKVLPGTELIYEVDAALNT